MMYGESTLKIGFPAILAWSVGVFLYYILSSLSPIHIPNWPTIGATIPSFIVSSLLYIIIMNIGKQGKKS